MIVPFSLTKTQSPSPISNVSSVRASSQIAANAGSEGAIVIERIREKNDLNFGYNAETNEYGDLVKQGVIDPTKVTRTALQNAASIAGLLLTTEAVVVEKKEKEEGMPMPPGGGMGGMY